MVKKEYPYSSLIDYEQLAREEEERKNKAQASQQKIMRTNAIGDALRLITDAIGGSQGASITPKAVNPGILKASDRYNALEDQYRADQQRYKLMDLGLKEKDVQHQLQAEALGDQRQWESDKIKEQRQWESDKMTQQNKWDTEKRAADFGNQKELDALKAKYAIQLEGARSRNDLLEIQERYKGEVEKILTKSKGDVEKAGGFYAARYDNPIETEALNRDVVIGMFKDLKKHLTEEKGIYPTMQPKVLQDENKGKISNDDLRKLISDYPEFFGPRLPQLTGGPGTAPMQAPPQLSPTEKRKVKYDQELEKIQTNLNLSPKERMRKIRQLQKNNKDILDLELIPTDASGVTDVSAIFK
jgi:hypothetical protein